MTVSSFLDRWFDRFTLPARCRSQRRKLARPSKCPRLAVEELQDRTLLSVNVLSLASGTPLATGNGPSELTPQSSVSNNGRYTVYESTATNLVANQSQQSNSVNVFLYDSQAGSTVLISHAAGDPATAATGTSFNAVISGDGSTVAFYSTSTNLISGLTIQFGSVQLYTYNIISNTYKLISHTQGTPLTGTNGVNPSIRTLLPTPWPPTLGYSTQTGGLALPSLSSDGRYIAYISDASDLGANNPNHHTNAYLYDLTADRNALISHAAGQPTTADGSGVAYTSTVAISADGSTVAFTHAGNNLVGGQSSVGQDDQLYISSRGQTVLASHAFGSITTGATITLPFPFTEENPPTLSADGTEVAYYSAGNNLVAGQSGTASVLNVFRYTVSTQSNELVTHVFGNNTTAGNNPQNQVSPFGRGPAEATGPQISADGRFIAYANNSNNLVSATPFSGDYDNVYEYDATTQQNTLVSNNGTAATPDTRGGTAPSMSLDGRYVSFMDLGVPATGSLGGVGTVNVCLFDRQAAAGTQPAVLGQSFDPATLQFYLAALQPTVISADGSTVQWSGPALATPQTNASVADSNGSPDVFAVSTSGTSSGTSSVSVGDETNTPTYGTAANNVTYTISSVWSGNDPGSTSPDVTISSLPTGVTASFSPTNLSNTSTSTTLTLTTTAAAAAVSSFSFAVTVTDSHGHTASNTGSFTINQRAVALTGSRTYDGTSTASSSILSVSNAVNGDTVTVGSGSATLLSKDAGSWPITSVATLALSNSNYTLTGATSSVGITPKALTVSGVTANNKVYNANPAATLNTSGATLVGLVNGDNVTLNTSSATATFATKDVGTGIAVTVSGLSPSNNQAGDYTLTQPTGLSADITPFALTVRGIMANDKVYDATTAAHLNLGNAMLVGVFNGDTVTLNTSGATGTFASKDVGTGINVAVSGLSLGGAQAGDYSLTQPTTSANITARALTITANSTSKTYGDTVTFTGSEFSVTSGTLFNGDISSVTLSSAGAAATAPVTAPGFHYPIVPSNAQGSGPNNYTIRYLNGSLTVTPRGTSVTPNAAGKTYGDPDPTLTGTLNGFLAADNVTATYSRTAGETVLGGPYTISATLSPTAVLSNYSITYNTANFTITPRSASVTPDAKSKTYGDPDPTLTGALGGFLAADNVTATYSRTAGETVLGGPYTISASLSPTAVLSNYTITSSTANFTITPKTLTITANSTSKTYGQIVTFAGTEFSTGGLVNGDSVSSVSLASAGAAATASVAGSPYSIVGSAAVGTGLGNYNISYVNGSLGVRPFAFTYTIGDDSQLHGTPADLAADLGTTIPTGVNGENLAITYSSTGDTATAGVGQYPIIGTLSNGSGLVSNYDVTLNPGTLTVNAGALTVQSLLVNDGSAQRSMVTSFTVTFSQPIASLDPGAFEIDRGATSLFPTDLTIAGNQVVIRFTGLAGVVGGSLADGRYTLVEHRGMIHGAGNAQLLADHFDAFFRLFGDVNGDGKVDTTDRTAFLAAYRSRRGMANYRWYFDANNDGLIDSVDYYQFEQRFGTGLLS
jgi:hypothetical protein